MNPTDDELYFRREQSQIKHVVLEKYLERFAIIVGQWAEGIIYVDGFSGPWNSVSGDFRDSSFAIALGQLRSARDTVRASFGKDLRIKCIFLERDPTAFAQLEAYAGEQKDVEITALNRDFKSAERKALQLAEAVRADAKRRARESFSGQPEFFGGTDVPERAHLSALQEHYELLAAQTVSALIQRIGEVPYDDIYAAAMRFPIVQESYLKRWLFENAEILHLGSQRAPKIGQGHLVRLRTGK